MPDDLESHRIWTRNEWDNNAYMKGVIDFLAEEEIKRPLDVGGCTGEFTNLLLEHIPTIESALIVEPIEQNYNFIRSHVLDSRVEIMKKALFESSDYLNLGRIDKNVGGWSFNYPGITVQCISLEKLVKYFQPDFVKLDIEGAERDIIENSTAIHDIEFLEIEFHDQYLEPEAWKSYVKDNLPNHQLISCGDHFCRQNAFFRKIN